MVARASARRTANTPDPKPPEPWALTRAISPRDRVRVAAVDAHGDVLNLYPHHRTLTDTAPEQPWAVYLAADDAFRLLAFDFDAKHGEPAADASTLSDLLEQAGIDHLVCSSGPGGGRHVWVALTDGAAPALVRSLARLLAALCPTLDTAPLSNPATGCVRPPGSPHRHGGASTVIAGSLDTLLQPTTTPQQITAVTAHIAARLSGRAATNGAEPNSGPLPIDPTGRRYLPGPRRPLPAASRAALNEDAASGDASAVLWRVLLGAAAARWRHSDIAELASTAPGLEHTRTLRDRGRRSPRPTLGPQSAAAVLDRQWDRAVAHVAATNRRPGDDPTFDARAGTIADHVRDHQTRADAAPGRWTRPGGPTDRRVLDTLCTLALAAVSADVEADVRRLALHAGIGRETARTALSRLAADSWIRQTRPAEGPHGAHWTIDPHGTLHISADTARSQADPRPEGAGSADRTSLLNLLTARLDAATHDLFTTPRGFGHYAGNLYARTTTTTAVVDDLARETGTTFDQLRTGLLALHTAGLVVLTATTCTRSTLDRRSTVATALGINGRLTTRRRRYQLERDTWNWWLAEHAWMATPGTRRAHRRPAHQTPLWRSPDNAYPKHPRTATGRADYRAARAAITAGALEQPTLPRRANRAAA